MKRHLLAAGFMAILGASIAWTQDAPLPVGESNQDLVNVLGHSFEEASFSGDDELREQLLRLVEDKAQLMDREDLEEALSEVQDDISELQALRKLEEARRILSSIVEEHVGTGGAVQAQEMLQTVAASGRVTSYATVKPEEPSYRDPGLTESELREQLLRLVEQKAQLMHREALEVAVSEVHDDIAELQALRKLEEACQILSSIVEDDPETEGAGRAQRMLEVDKKRLPSEFSPYFPGPI